MQQQALSTRRRFAPIATVERDTAMLFCQVPSFHEVADTDGMTPRALVVCRRRPPQYAGHHHRAQRYG